MSKDDEKVVESMAVESQLVDACLAHDHVDLMTVHLTYHRCLLYAQNKLGCHLIIQFHRHDLSDAPLKEKTF